MNKPSQTKFSSAIQWLTRLVRHYMVAGKRGTFVCARGLTHHCVIRGIIYDSPFHAHLGYRIDYVVSDTGAEVKDAEISTESFKFNY